MLVYQINHADMGSGWITPTPDDFYYELEEDLFENGEDCGYKKQDIALFIEKAKSLKVGEEVELGGWFVKCSEMDEEKYINLPEFSGW